MLSFAIKPFAQEKEAERFDTLALSVSKLQTDFDVLKKLKISGFIHAQFQLADSVGISSFAGGNFPAYSDKRFTVRRGRLKATYSQPFSKYVVQFDITEKGVGIKDAYSQFTENVFNSFSLTTGVFDRPFGFEIGYSSGSRETPERSMLFQTLFPGEREVGAKLTFQPPKTSNYNFLTLEAGLFNGTGPTASDFDKMKDFIGRLSIIRSAFNEKFQYSGGVSYYKGGYRQNTKFIYENIGQLHGNITGFNVDSNTTNIGSYINREYKGADAQFSFVFPFGITTLRGEYIFGIQPGTTSTTRSPSADPNTDAYLREFSGGYVGFLQNIFNTKHQIVVKYDWYDPNIKVEDDQIGVKNSKLGKADIAYSTLGLGWVYRYDNNIKFTFYYDIVKNEISNNLNGFTRDLKDNVLTIRLQYKF